MALPKRKENRLKGFDYSSPNAYFITICTMDRKALFWDDGNAIVSRPEDVVLSGCGKLVKQAICEIPAHYPLVAIDCFTIMPNHVHILMRIEPGQTKPDVSNVVRQMKRVVSKQAGFAVWQKGFYDHVVRDDADYQKIWNYIEGNPMKWEDDRYRAQMAAEMAGD